MKSQVNELIATFFNDLLEIETQVTIDQTDDEILVQLNLEPQDSGVIIGYRGEVLTAVQLILSLMVQKHADKWMPVRVNINDYKEQRLKTLENLAHNTAAKVIQTGRPATLSRLSSYERRVVHSALAEHPEVTTQSEGEEPYRVLVISPKAV